MIFLQVLHTQIWEQYIDYLKEKENNISHNTTKLRVVTNNFGTSVRQIQTIACHEKCAMSIVAKMSP